MFWSLGLGFLGFRFVWGVRFRPGAVGFAVQVLGSGFPLWHSLPFRALGSL